MGKMTKHSRSHTPQRQLELGLKMRVADLHFFKVFSAAIVHHGLIAKLGASAFAILLTMKANSRPSDGRIYVGISELATQTGLSENTVRSSIKRLVTLGFIEKKTEPAGKKLHYYVFDEFHFRRLYEGESESDALDKLHAGDADGMVRLPYRPAQNRDDIAQLQTFLHGGPKPEAAQLVMVEKQLVGQQQVGQQFVAQQVVNIGAVIVQADGSSRVATEDDVWASQLARAAAIKATLKE